MSKPEKILVLFGSPNKKGFTASLTKLFLEQYTASLHNEVLVETIYTYDLGILPCRGCSQCNETGVCIFNAKDDYNNLLSRMLEADFLVVASPVYFLSFPAPLKAVIDRMQQAFGIKFGNGNGKNEKLRRGCLIATCGSDDPTSFQCMERSVRMFFDCLDAAFTERLFARNTDHPDAIKIADYDRK